jgi:hypothetical protein
MSPKEIIERCNDMIKRLAHEAYGNQNPEAIKDLNVLDEIIEIIEMRVSLNPMQPEMDTDGSTIIPCGYCGGKLQRIHDYCPWCGQKIDWGK